MLINAEHHDLAQELRRVLGISSEAAEERVRLAIEDGPKAVARLAAEVLKKAPTHDATSFVAAAGEERPTRRPPGPPSPPPPPKGNKVG